MQLPGEAEFRHYLEVAAEVDPIISSDLPNDDPSVIEAIDRVTEAFNAWAALI